MEIPGIFHRDQESAQETKRPKPLANTVLGRTLYYGGHAAQGRILAALPPTRGRDVRQPVFIIGCGRSGTTLLGRIFSLHPDVKYLFEPNHLWAAIDASTDFSQVYSRGDYHCFLDADSVTTSARRRFSRLLSSPEGVTLVEKSPTNALRIGYLNALAPDARFVHIVRDGIAVARSIEKMATTTRRVLFRSPVNDWWGSGGAKWSALRQDGRAAGYYRDEVDRLATSVQRAAYEWLLSVREAEMWRAPLDSRFSTIRYEDLGDDPCTIIRELMTKLELACPDYWLRNAAKLVRAPIVSHREPIALPSQMYTDFNTWQERFGFEGRATELV